MTREIRPGGARGRWRAVVAALVTGLAGGCHHGLGPADPPRHAAPTRSWLLAVRGQVTSPATLADLDAAMAQAQAIYVGEAHDDPHIHEVQRKLFERALAQEPPAQAAPGTQSPGAAPPLGLGLEMLPRTMQGPLDDYAAGRADEAAFLAAVDWPKTWGYPFDYYRPLLALCREHRLPAYALNAPSSLSRAVARGGLAGLADADKRALPEIVPGPPAHRAQLEAAFKEHGGGKLGPEVLERYYQAQLVWDETMADSVARALAAPGAPRRILVALGDGHARRFAVPDRARRRGVARDVVVLPVYKDQLESDTGEGADFLWVME